MKEGFSAKESRYVTDLYTKMLEPLNLVKIKFPEFDKRVGAMLILEMMAMVYLDVLPEEMDKIRKKVSEAKISDKDLKDIVDEYNNEKFGRG